MLKTWFKKEKTKHHSTRPIKGVCHKRNFAFFHALCKNDFVFGSNTFLTEKSTQLFLSRKSFKISSTPRAGLAGCVMPLSFLSPKISRKKNNKIFWKRKEKKAQKCFEKKYKKLKTKFLFLNKVIAMRIYFQRETLFLT